MINIVLFGPPGAGKGTQSEKLIAKYGFVHLSTGDIFRRNIKEATELGQLAKSYMDQGQLVPDSVTISMLQAEVLKNEGAKGFIFDGFPRNANQAKALDEFLNGHGTSITKMIALEVPEEELRKRLMERGKSSGRPDDVDPLIIQKRIDVYNSETAPVKDFYHSQGKYAGVNGVGTIDSIFILICGLVDGAQPKMAEPEKPLPVVKTETPPKKKTAAKSGSIKNIPAKKKNTVKPKTKKTKAAVARKTKKTTSKKISAKKTTTKKRSSAKKPIPKKKKTARRGRPASPKKRGRPQIKKRGRPNLPKKRGRPQIKKRGRPTLPKKRGRPQIKKRGRPTLPKRRGRPQIKKRGRPTLPKRRGRPQIKKRGRPVIKKTVKKSALKKSVKRTAKGKKAVSKKGIIRKTAPKRKQVKKKKNSRK